MKKKIVLIIILALLLILLIPKIYALNDGGTKIYKSLTYEITKVHKLKYDSLNEFDEGTIVKILGKEVYNSVPEDILVFDENKEKEESSISYVKVIDNISIEINIPKNWKYEELARNAENDFYKYALKMYKKQEDKYAVLYFYNNIFGVCGTGRTSEEIDLDNGNKAAIGYYDSKDVWQDISFYETNKYIAIINYGLDKDEADDFLGFIKTIDIKENDETTEAIELFLKDNTLTSNGATFVLKNNSNETYRYGPEYEIEAKEDYGWHKIELEQPLVWNVLYLLNANEIQEFKIDFSYGYGELSNGRKYRLVKRAYKEGETINKSKGTYLYAEFEIK